MDKYFKQGLISNNNDLLLFQYDNCVIASGTLDNVIVYQNKDFIQNFGHKGAIVLKKQ